MKKIFNYNKFNIGLADEIVDSMYTLTQKYLEGKSNTNEYQEMNQSVNEKFMKYCVESIPNTTFTSLQQIGNPMIHKNIFFLQTFDTILAQVITPVAPTVMANGYEELYDVTQVGWGVA